VRTQGCSAFLLDYLEGTAMRGYVVKKGKSYYAVVYDGVDPGTGKEKRKWVSAGPRRSDAEKLVTDLVKRRNQGVSVATEKLTLGEYLTGRWLPIQESSGPAEHVRFVSAQHRAARVAGAGQDAGGEVDRERPRLVVRVASGAGPQGGDSHR